MELEAKQKLMARLDENLLSHARNLAAGDGPRIVDVYRLQGLAEVHCYLKTEHQFDPAEVEALLQFADPLNVAYNCWEVNRHQYSFPICELMQEIRAEKVFEPAKPEPPAKSSVKDQLQAAMRKAHQRPHQAEKSHDDGAR